MKGGPGRGFQDPLQIGAVYALLRYRNLPPAKDCRRALPETQSEFLRLRVFFHGMSQLRRQKAAHLLYDLHKNSFIIYRAT